MEPNVNNMNNDEIEIDLMLLFRSIVARIWMVILAGVICGLTAYIVSNFLMTEKYVSKAQLYVINRQDEGNMTYSDIQSSTQLVKDYKVLIVSRPVVEQVISNLDLDMTTSQLVENVSVSIALDSRVLVVTVTDTDPYMAKKIVDNLADISAVRICDVMEIEGVNIIEYGNVPTEPASPNVGKFTMIGIAAGLFLACVIIIINTIMDDSVKTSEDIEKYLGLSTLALIPVTEEEYDGAPRDPKKKKKKKKVVRRK